VKTTNVGIMDINVKTNISKHGSEIQSTKKKIHGNRYEPKVALDVTTDMLPTSFIDSNVSLR
jgi:hypothetical protein